MGHGSQILTHNPLTHCQLCFQNSSYTMIDARNLLSYSTSSKIGLRVRRISQNVAMVFMKFSLQYLPCLLKQSTNFLTAIAKTEVLRSLADFYSTSRAETTSCLKKVPPLACYNFDTHEWILIFLAEMLPIK